MLVNNPRKLIEELKDLKKVSCLCKLATSVPEQSMVIQKCIFVTNVGNMDCRRTKPNEENNLEESNSAGQNASTGVVLLSTNDCFSCSVKKNMELTFTL
ncbi:hypothetical protein RJT34_21955 [Clitoria ternatea]|uniref:Uncharacterized protein n=1 Tax=Clitoria ternatea TaxID=43366 RepID=A0AAN9IUS1_CLITE